MEDLLLIKNNVPMVSSQLVAEKFNKVHAKLIRDIDNLHCSDEFKDANFGTYSFTNKMNRSFTGYTMTKDGFAFLCMGFTGKKAAEWKEKYINAFNSMEESLHDIDYRMNKLTSDQVKIKEAGSNWSAMGHEINKAKKENKRLSDELVSEVQFSLSLEG